MSLNQSQPATVAQIPVLKPEYLNMVPEFSGEPELLNRFITICEKLVTKFYNIRDALDFQNEYLMSSILAKIKGDAAVNISSCVIETWKELKDALLNTYGDKRDCFSLNMELTNLKQSSNESPFDFYNKIQHVLNLQSSYLVTHLAERDAKVLIDYFQTYSVRVLLHGLREPIGSLMRTKNPQSLNVALNMLTNDFQFDQYQRELKPKQNHPNIQKPNTFQPRPFTRPQFQRPNFNMQNRFPNANHNQNFQRNNNFNQFNRNPNQFRPNPGHNQNFNRHPNQSNQNPNQFNRNPNQFNQRPNNPQGPTPMSISTASTYRPPNRQELFNIESEQVPENIDFLGETASGSVSN